jgi:hypothetical protein
MATQSNSNEPTNGGGLNGISNIRHSSQNNEEQSKKEAILKQKCINNQLLASRDCCKDTKNSKSSNCRCLTLMHENVEYCQAVAEYQLLFDKLSYKQQKMIEIEWMRSSSNAKGKLKYHIPFLLNMPDNTEHFKKLKDQPICANAVMDLLGKGLRWWRSCAKHFRDNSLPEHKLTGSPSNRKKRFRALYENDLNEHFAN